MAELNEQQVELIAAYIRQHGVASDALFDDLLDHICTSIESIMAEGRSFEEAFAQTIKLFGPGGLRQVQQQTFELLTEMNETMKKVAFLFGLTSAMLLLAGTIFKLNHLAGAGVLIVLGGALLTLGYLPLLLWHKLKESPSDERLLHITGFVGMALTALGTTFKIMHWPGAGIMLLSGLGVLGALYLPIYFIKKYKTSSNKPVTLSSSIVALTCLVLVIAMVSLRPSSSFNHALASISLELQESSDRLDLSAELDGIPLHDERSVSIQRQADSLWSNLQFLKTELIAEAEGMSLGEASTTSIDQLHHPYDLKASSEVLWGSGDGSDSKAQQLIEQIEAFEAQVLHVYPEHLIASVKAGLPLPVDGAASTASNLEWARQRFYHVPLVSAIGHLSKLQLDVRQLKTQAILYITSQPAASVPPSGS